MSNEKRLLGGCDWLTRAAPWMSLTALLAVACSSSSPSTQTGDPATAGSAGYADGARAGAGAAGGAGIAGSGVGGTPGAGGAAGTAGTAGTAGADAAASALLVPAQGALLGAFVGTGTFTDLETLLGRSVTIKHTFVGWTDDYTGYVQADAAAGHIPLITWEAWNNGVGASLDEIIAGTHDSMIQSRANVLKGLGKKFFLRWGHEMNGNWYPWSGATNGANAAATAKYIAAYRHVHDVFVAAGGSNALWIFCPNVDSVPAASWNVWTNYYPGDAYVDWVGFDGYNWGTSTAGQTWQSFPSIASRIYPALAALGKPMMVPETASAEVGGDKMAWVTAILPSLKTSFPQIKAFVWFDMNKETDWRVDSSAGAQQAFSALANDPYMNP